MNFSPVSFTYTKRNNIYFKSNNDLFTPNTSFSSIVRQPDCFRLSTPGANSHEKYYAAFYDAIQKTDENIDYDTDYVYEKMRSKMDKIKEPNLRERIRKIIEKGFYLHFILEVCKIENNIFVRFPNLEAFVKDFTPDSKYFHRFMMVLNECGINDKSEFVEIVNAFDFKSNRELSRLCYRRPECCIGGYKVANNKELFLKYPDLLAEAYSREKDSDEPDYSSIDRLAEHLFVIGAQNSEDFLQKCGQLAPSFNDFEFQADKLEALEYHQSTYKHKLQLIKQIFDTKGINGVNCEEFYKRNLKYIDCLYEENNGENLGNLDDNIHHFLDKRQIKQSVLNRVQDRFNNFENIKDEIDLYSLLTKTKTSISEFTTLAEETIVDGIHPIDKVLKKNEVVAKIAQIKSISEAKALEIYNKYSSILTLLTTVSSEQQQEYLSIFLERLDDEVFKNQNSVVKFYNLINKKSKI